MFRFLCSFLFVSLFSLSVFSQTNSFQTSHLVFTARLPEQKSIRQTLDSDSIYPNLASFEKEFIYFLNYARQYPRLFSLKAVVPYLDAYPEFKPIYGESLVVELSRNTAIPVLLPEKRLVQLARGHSKDISAHDFMSHNSFNGASMEKRFDTAGIGCGSECINMLSTGSALEVLLSLLVDYRVTNFGHRKSLLNEKMVFVGVGVGNSKTKLQYTVVDLGCK